MNLIFILSLLANSYSMDTGIQVFGECSKDVTPDRSSIQFTVKKINKISNVASRQSKQVATSLIKKIKALDLPDAEIKTISFNVSEQFDWVNGKRKSRGFEANYQLFVSSSESEKIGETITLADKLGVEGIGALSFFVSEPLQKKIHLDCLGEAVLDAKEKAELVAKKMGIGLGKPSTISEFVTPISSRPMMMTMADMGSNESARIPLEKGRTKIQLRVVVNFSIKD